MNREPSAEALMPGPCIICGLSNYPLSMGGPTICPSCDCGDFGPTKVERQRKEFERLTGLYKAAVAQEWRVLQEARAEIEQLTEHLATNDRILDHVRKELAKDSSLVNKLNAEVERLKAGWETAFNIGVSEQEQNKRLRAEVEFRTGLTESQSREIGELRTENELLRAIVLTLLDVAERLAPAPDSLARAQIDKARVALRGQSHDAEI